MYLVIAVMGLMIFGVGLGVILAMARRRLDAADGRPMVIRKIVGEEQEPPIEAAPAAEEPRPSMLGTPDLRLKAMWLGASFSFFGVTLLIAGATFMGELMFLIGLMIALQAMILAGMARLRGVSADAPSDS